MHIPRSLLLLGCLLTASPVLVLAQATSPAIYALSGDSAAFAQKTQTQPLDDAVLPVAPAVISLRFPQRVRLVKLTLRNEKRDWVDIDFRYNPRLGDSFALNLPTLEVADYYTADWAVLGTNDQLLRGSFSFSFGVDAKPPSILREVDELLLQLRHGDPAVRTVMPPRTEIIINRDPPQYDPPFTIKLDPSTTQTPC